MNSRELTDDRLGELAAYGSRAIPVGQKDRTISELARELAAAREALAQAEQRERALRAQLAAAREAISQSARRDVSLRDALQRWSDAVDGSDKSAQTYATVMLARAVRLAVATQPGDGQREAGGGTER